MRLVKYIQILWDNLFNISLGLFQKLFFKKTIPPLIFPLSLALKFTMNGKVWLRYHYCNNVVAVDRPVRYTKEMVDLYIGKVRKKETFYYGKTDTLLYQALEKYSIKGKKVAIMGSTSPLYESICIVYGGEPITIDYNKIISEDPRIKAMTVSEYDYAPIRFEIAFSISSFEHDGLGRYGDPINPDGDLLAMKKMKKILLPKGLLFLSVPVGKDTLVWNERRIYGKYRLPLLLDDWELIESFGFSEDLLYASVNKYEPIFVLRNTATS